MARMAGSKNKNQPPFEFARYGVCLLGPPPLPGQPNDSAERRHAMERARSELHASWSALSALMTPRRRLPPLRLIPIAVSPAEATISSALEKAMSMAARPNEIRLVVHRGLEADLSEIDLKRFGMPLLLSVSDSTSKPQDLGWRAANGGVALVVTSHAKLTSAIHDIVLDIWMGNHIEEPGLSALNALRKREQLFGRKVAYARKVLAGGSTTHGPLADDAAYVSLASIARAKTGAMDYVRYLTLWRNFAHVCGGDVDESGNRGGESPQVPGGPVDRQRDPSAEARIVLAHTGRSVNLRRLLSQLKTQRANEIAVIVKLRPGSSRIQETHLRALGLGKVNSTAVMNTGAEEYGHLRRLIEDLRMEKRIEVIMFTGRQGAV